MHSLPNKLGSNCQTPSPQLSLLLTFSRAGLTFPALHLDEPDARRRFWWRAFFFLFFFPWEWMQPWSSAQRTGRRSFCKSAYMLQYGVSISLTECVCLRVPASVLRLTAQDADVCGMQILWRKKYFSYWSASTGYMLELANGQFKGYVKCQGRWTRKRLYVRQEATSKFHWIKYKTKKKNNFRH